MFDNKKLVNGLVAKVRRAEKDTLEDYAEGRAEHEPSITDRFIGSLQHGINHATIAGIRWTVTAGGLRWTAKTLTSSGTAGGQEKEFGADFLAAFAVDVSGFKVAKGFLAQAKRVEPADVFPPAESTRLRRQCELMLNHSSAAYVFLYSKQSGMLVVPAVEVLAARDCNPHELTAMPLTKFLWCALRVLQRRSPHQGGGP
jgi:hypothetical protein